MSRFPHCGRWKFSRKESGDYPPGAEFDSRAPWNEQESKARCVHCGEEFILGDLEEQRGGEVYLCYECIEEHGIRICDSCGGALPLAELLSEIPPSAEDFKSAQARGINLYAEIMCLDCAESARVDLGASESGWIDSLITCAAAERIAEAGKGEA